MADAAGAQSSGSAGLHKGANKAESQRWNVFDAVGAVGACPGRGPVLAHTAAARHWQEQGLRIAETVSQQGRGRRWRTDRFP